MPISRSASAAWTATGFPAWSTPRPTRRCSGCGRRCSIPNVTLVTNARVDAAEDEPDRHRGHRGHRRARRARPRATAARSSSSPAAPRTPPSCCSRRPTTSTRAASPTGRTRWAATTCSTTARPCWRSRRSRTRPATRRRWAQRLLLRRTGLRLPAGQHPDGRQVAGADVPGREAARQAGADVHAGRSWPSTPSTSGCATEDLPRAENRVTLERDGSIRLSYTKNNQVPTQRALRAAQVDAGAPGHAPEHLIPRNLYLKNEMDIGARRAPGRHLPLRHRSEDVGAGHQLQGARARQPLRRRHQLLPQHRRREPGL